MLNFYDIVKIFGIENLKAIEEAKEDFLEDYRNFYNSIRLSEKEREKNLLSFVANSVKDEANPGLYANENYIIYTNEVNQAAKSKGDLYKILKKEVFEAPKKSVDNLNFDFYGSLANAKALGFRANIPNNYNYVWNIDGHYYNFALVYEIWQLIGTGKKSDRVELKLANPDSKYPWLMIWTKKGFAVLLPTTNPGKYDVSEKYFMEVCKIIEDAYREKWEGIA